MKLKIEDSRDKVIAEFSEAESADILARAKKAGVTPQVYMRRLLKKGIKEATERLNKVN